VLLLLGAPTAAQTNVLLKSMPAIRGLEAQGRGGLTGFPPAAVPGTLGQSSAVVDLDGDGFDDLIVGAPKLPILPGSGVLDDAGHVYVLFGSAGSGLPGSSGDFNFGNFAQGQAVDLRGEPGDQAGAAVAAAGDVNGDGRQDVIVGTPGHTFAGRTNSGGAYLLFGRADWKTLPKAATLASLAAGAEGRGVFLGGARAFGGCGSAVSGGVDGNADGRDDVVLGAPLDSTNGHSQNGTATVLYGQVNFPTLHSIDLLPLGAGAVTVVHGTDDLQFMGFSVAGIGRFDPVLPMTNNQVSALLGDDIAIGAPGTTVGAKFFAGAVYVLRGVASGTPAASYTAASFGNGPNTAGIVYTGKDTGDEAGFWVAPAGDAIYDGQGFDDFLATAPFNDGIGKPDCGSVYVLGGNFLGFNPQGFDLGTLGHGDPSLIGIHIQGAGNGNGSQGVYAVTAGDWNGDGLTDLLVGFPNTVHIEGSSTLTGAGRARLLNGAKVLFAFGTVNLADVNAGYQLMQFDGETAGSWAGNGLAHGDFNGDGQQDISIGAPGAASDPNPADPTGLANSKTGRAHVIYGPVLREQSVLPFISHFGGPPVTITALNVPTGNLLLKVNGQVVTPTTIVPGATGTITFAPPPPQVFGQLVDLSVKCDNGALTMPDALQYANMSVTSGPVPSSGLAGSTVTFTGQAFSTLADMSLTFGGVPAAITAVDGLAGTLSATLPFGVAMQVPVDVVLHGSNGHVVLDDAFTFLPLQVTSVVPNSGPQTSGVFAAGVTPYEGQPVVTTDITLATSSGTLPGGLTIELGTDALGWTPAPIVATSGLVVTVNVPSKLLGPADTLVGVRVTGDGDTVVQPNAFTYLASDFKDLPQYAKAGFGSQPPRAAGAGSVTNGSNVLLLMDQLPTQQQLVVLFGGIALVNPPLHIKGGELPINLGLPHFTTFLPFPGLTSIPMSLTVPLFDPAGNGAKLYVQFLTMEKQGNETRFGFSNVLELTIHFVP